MLRLGLSVAYKVKTVKKKEKEAYSSLCYKHRTATGTHMGITQ